MLHTAALLQRSHEDASAMGRLLRSCRVSVSLTPHEKDVLERVAEKSGLSLSRVIQEAVSEFLVSQEDEKLEVIRKTRTGQSQGK